MKTYKVAVHYEVGVVIEFDAESPEDAETQAIQLLEYEGNPEDFGKTVHRDFLIATVEEK